MTVSTTDSIVDFSSGGPDFPIPYRFLQNSDIEAVLTKQDGTTETLTGAQYTLTGAGAQSGGTLTSTYAAGVLAVPGATLTVSRVMVAVQPTDLRNQGRFLAETHENVFDRLTMLIQQGFAWTRRALLRPIGKDYYDAEGRRIANVGDPVLQGDAVNKLSMEQYVASVIAGGSGDLNLASHVLYIGPDGATYTVQDIANKIDPARGAALVGYTGYGANTTVKQVLDQLLRGGLHPSMFGYAPGDDIAELLNTVQYPFDLRGDSYIVSAGVTRRSSLFNGAISYAGSAPTGAFANAIVAYTETADLDARRMHVTYTGSSSGIVGICAYAGTHRINLRGSYAGETTSTGIRVQGCDWPDLTGCGAENCVKDSVGSTDFAVAYGAIAVFGGTAVSNFSILHQLYVSGTSTGLSIAYGVGHSVRDCNLICTDKNASPELSMGVYAIGQLAGLEIQHCRVTNYPLEGIDVHNTGAGAVIDMTGIHIHHNHVRGSGYLGISVVSGASPKIRDANIHHNVIEVDGAGAPLGYGGGIAVVNVSTVAVEHNRCFISGTPAQITSSFGLQSDGCEHIKSRGNYYRGNWGVYEVYSDWNGLLVDGTHGEPIPAGSEGVRLVQKRANASSQLRNISLIAGSGTAKVVRQVGVSLTVCTIQACYFNGAMDIGVGIQDGVVSNNLFRNFSGSIVLGNNSLAFDNPGWLSVTTASASPVSGPIKAWAPYRIGTTTYKVALYSPTTL